MKLFFLSREHEELARAELSAFANQPQFEKNLGFASTTKNPDRLALAKTAGELLFSCDTKNLEEKARRFNWQCRNNFRVERVRLDQTTVDIKNIAEIIHKKTGRPAKMKNPETLFEIFLSNGKAYVTKRIWKNTSRFMERKSHKRPAPHPTSIHPKLARAMINLTGVRNGTIVDPFCGSGGILLEAGLMGLNVRGYDILDKMLEMSEINLKHWGISDYKLKKKDALDLEKCRYVVTDLPYGKNSTASEINELYCKFLEVLRKKLVKRAVVVFPDFFYYKKYTKGLKIEQEFKWYIHKSMTRYVVVLSKLI